jgi:hypothetical protein
MKAALSYFIARTSRTPNRLEIAAEAGGTR